MEKHPMEYTKETISTITNRPVKLYVGSPNSEEVSSTAEGVIINCSLSANPPNLPASLEIELQNGKRKSYSLPEIKRIQLL